MSRTILHESTCTWKSSCINSMGSSFLRPVITQQTLVNSALTANVLALDRHCSATMFAVFLRSVTAVLNSVLLLNCERATQGFPADRAPVYRGCPDRDPLGCPLIPGRMVPGKSANPLAAATAENNSTAACVCARTTHIGQAFTNKTGREQGREQGREKGREKEGKMKEK